MPRITLLSALSALLLTASLTHAAGSEDFEGQGEIHVLNSESYDKARPSDRIGCLDKTGALTVNNCAVFTKVKGYPDTLATEAGNCTFSNRAMPENSDNVYGRESFAYSCSAENLGEQSITSTYSINGFPYPFICTGNIRCFYDIPAIPSAASNKTNNVPLWVFYYGSQQFDVNPGHLRVLWLWVPVKKPVMFKA